jgi:polar amino acid transport system substrate-binding protein
MIARNGHETNIYSSFLPQEDASMDLNRFIPILAASALAFATAGHAADPSPQDADARAALAPTGTLRIAVYVGSPTSLVADGPAEERKGVGHDLGVAMAKRLGVPYEVVVFPKNVDALEAVKTGRADAGFTNATAARSKDMDFGTALFAVEQGYLVPPGSPVSGADVVDRKGMRVVVTQGSTSDSVLSRELKNATLIKAPTINAARDLLASRKADAFATNKAILFEVSDTLPGATVLDGRWGMENFAIAVPKGREAGMAFLRLFSKEVVADGQVKKAIERAGLRGTTNASSS